MSRFPWRLALVPLAVLAAASAASAQETSIAGVAIKAGPVHEVLATNSVGERVYASPAIANGRIYIRGERHLFAIGAAGRR